MEKPSEDHKRQSEVGCAIALIVVISPFLVLERMVSDPNVWRQVRFRLLMTLGSKGESGRAKPKDESGMKRLSDYGRKRRKEQERRVNEGGR